LDAQLAAAKEAIRLTNNPKPNHKFNIASHLDEEMKNMEAYIREKAENKRTLKALEKKKRQEEQERIRIAQEQERLRLEQEEKRRQEEQRKIEELKKKIEIEKARIAAQQKADQEKALELEKQRQAELEKAKAEAAAAAQNKVPVQVDKEGAIEIHLNLNEQCFRPNTALIQHNKNVVDDFRSYEAWYKQNSPALSKQASEILGDKFEKFIV
jgi:TolA-binding protein